VVEAAKPLRARPDVARADWVSNGRSIVDGDKAAELKRRSRTESIDIGRYELRTGPLRCSLVSARAYRETPSIESSHDADKEAAPHGRNVLVRCCPRRMRNDSDGRPYVGTHSVRSDTGTCSRYRDPSRERAEADRGVLRDLRSRKSGGERHLYVGLAHR